MVRIYNIDETMLRRVLQITFGYDGLLLKLYENKQILTLSISEERNIFVATERFRSSFSKNYGKHAISTDNKKT